MNFIDILSFKWWVSQFHFVAAEKNEFAVGVKILLLGKKSPKSIQYCTVNSRLSLL